LLLITTKNGLHQLLIYYWITADNEIRMEFVGCTYMKFILKMIQLDFEEKARKLRITSGKRIELWKKEEFDITRENSRVLTNV
jgi:hypothetical protein